MFKTIANAFKVKEVRNKILLTLLLLFIFRVGCWIPLPGIDISVFSQTASENQFLGLLSSISGGALANGSILALGVSPYISASIIIQLLTVAIPALERLSKEGGDEGRKKRFLVKGEEAEKILKDVLEEKNAFDDLELQLEEVEPRCEISHHLKALDLEKTIHKKVDYIAQASKNAEDGARGEALALEYERKRLANIGLSDYIDKISWVSVESDSFGYDIASYDLIDGKVKKIQIEVKTTSSKIDREFFVSKAEVETSKRLSNTYYIYRIYHLYSLHPKIYRVRGALTDNFEIDPISYVAYYRGPASIALRK